MIKLHASYGLKVPADQEFSSKSYHASAEIEVADTALHNGLRDTLAKLWAELRNAVENELKGSPSSSGNGQPRTAPSSAVLASTKQLGFLLSCAKRFRNMNSDQAKEWLVSEYQTDLNSLTKSQASRIIDTLQDK